MTTHQDELSSMQYELDVGLDAFSEAMARAKPDDTCKILQIYVIENISRTENRECFIIVTHPRVNVVSG